MEKNPNIGDTVSYDGRDYLIISLSEFTDLAGEKCYHIKRGKRVLTVSKRLFEVVSKVDDKHKYKVYLKTEDGEVCVASFVYRTYANDFCLLYGNVKFIIRPE